MKQSFFRKDIQNLRGLAIFFVLIFHFYPDSLAKVPSRYISGLCADLPILQNKLRSQKCKDG